ncbi:hypothetical protein V8G54_018960 [Vigna mungo]|uniref:Uncharacterized protein n=1 Tax=Vigna mungo TaxID=3915 RepID=A0AAQ3RV67_VIGMU
MSHSSQIKGIRGHASTDHKRVCKLVRCKALAQHCLEQKKRHFRRTANGISSNHDIPGEGIWGMELIKYQSGIVQFAIRGRELNQLPHKQLVIDETKTDYSAMHLLKLLEIATFLKNHMCFLGTKPCSWGSQVGNFNFWATTCHLHSMPNSNLFKLTTQRLMPIGIT